MAKPVRLAREAREEVIEAARRYRFLMMLGYSSGTSAEAEIHGNLQKLLDLEAFLAWISTVTGA